MRLNDTIKIGYNINSIKYNMGSGYQQCMYVIAIIRPCKYCINIYLNRRNYLIYYF